MDKPISIHFESVRSLLKQVISSIIGQYINTFDTTAKVRRLYK
jgi:hypothetical protein